MKKILSKHILKQSIRGNWRLWLILTVLMCVFISVLTLAVPNMARRSRFGAINVLSIYSMAFFGAQGIIISLIFAVAAANKLVAGEIDRGTMSFTLNTPTTRLQIILSKALFYIMSIVLMVAAVATVAITVAAAAKVSIDYPKFFAMVSGFLLYIFATSGICFCASCLFNKSGHAIAVGAGFPVVFFLLGTLSKITESLEFLKYFTLETLFNTDTILSGGIFWWQFVVLFAVGATLYTAGIIRFLRKDLPL